MSSPLCELSSLGSVVRMMWPPLPVGSHHPPPRLTATPRLRVCSTSLRE